MSFEDNSTNWPIYTLDTVCTVTDCQHKTAPTVDYKTKFRMLRTTNIRNGRIIVENAKYVTEEVYEAWSVRGKLEINDVILTREAPMGEVGIIKDLKEKLFLGQRMLQLKADKDKILPHFLYYSLLSPHLQRQIKVHEGTGSVVSNIRIPALKKFKLFVPGMNVQKIITQILRNIDDKIELNNAINKNLEEMAQALFKRWFIDFEFPNEYGEPYKSSGGEFEESELGLIPKGWRVGTLKELISINSGKRPSVKAPVKSEEYRIPLVGASGIMGYVTEHLYGDPILVTGRVGTLGVVQRYGYPVWPSDNTLVIKSNYYEFSYQLLLGVDFNSLNRGSTQPLVSQSDIKNISRVMPDDAILGKFETLASDLFRMVDKNELENTLLVQLRDTLLPRLMSGEIRVLVDEHELMSSTE